MNLQEKLIKIGEKHFNEELLPKMKEFFGEDINNFIIWIEGSVSYGYCDKLSDVDFGVFYTKILNEKQSEFLKELMQDYWVGKTRLSYADNSRTGKRIIEVLNENMDKVWEVSDLYFFFNVTSFYSVFDSNNVIKNAKEKIKFYPHNFLKEIIRGFWLTANNSLYVAEQCLDRKKKIEGYISLYKGIEAMLRLIYNLNNKYFPPTKWLTTGFGQIENDLGAKKYLKKIKGNNLKNDIKIYGFLLNNIKSFMLTNKSIEKTSIESCYSIFKNELPWRIFDTF